MHRGPSVPGTQRLHIPVQGPYPLRAGVGPPSHVEQRAWRVLPPLPQHSQPAQPSLLVGLCAFLNTPPGPQGGSKGHAQPTEHQSVKAHHPDWRGSICRM
jgi:hypothetical protein